MNPRILLILTASLFIVGAILVNSNHRNALAQGRSIVAADAKAADTTATLASLLGYARTHTGASLSLVLNGAYSRAQAAALAATQAASAANSQIYADAQRVCGGRSAASVQTKCNQDYISSHLQTLQSATPAAAPKLSDYSYRLRSPIWAPDAAGAVLLGAVVSLGALIYARLRRAA